MRNKLTTALIVGRLTHAAIDFLERKWLKRSDVAAFTATDNPDLLKLVSEIAGLLDAIQAGRAVFFVCEKHSNGHRIFSDSFYSLHYVTADGQREMFWPWSDVGAKLMGMRRTKGDQYRTWVFATSVTGMDRITAATGFLHDFLTGLADVPEFTNKQLI